MSQQKLVLGFDIGGTKIGIGLGTGDGKLLGKGRIENVNTVRRMFSRKWSVWRGNWSKRPG